MQSDFQLFNSLMTNMPALTPALTKTKVDTLADRFRALQQHGIAASSAKSNKSATERPATSKLAERLQAMSAPYAPMGGAVAALHAERNALWQRAEEFGRQRSLLEDTVSAEFAEARRAREQGEARLLRTIDERTSQAMQVIAHERRSREETDERAASDLSELAAAITAERRERLWRMGQLEERHERMMHTLRADIARERELRERAMAETSAMLDELLGSLRADLRQEQQDREQAEAIMMRALEDGLARRGGAAGSVGAGGAESGSEQDEGEGLTRSEAAGGAQHGGEPWSYTPRAAAEVS